MSVVPIRHGHLFCGLGGGARGFQRAGARVGQMEARMECVGGIDIDPAGIADFFRLTGVRGTVLDLASREQYRALHDGAEPPDGWREATPADIRQAMHARPNIWFLSAPCKGFSGLTSQTISLTDKYQAMNALTLRGIWLALEAYANDPVEFLLFENVPRIASRGAHLLDQIEQLLRHFGYAVARTTHDCGELGGLAQSRKRFLLVARHVEKVPPFLYEPRTKPLRGVGEVLGRLPMPSDPLAGALHRLPALQWKTWVRLAFVEAGKDWRSLQRLTIEDGMLRDYGIAPVDANWYAGALGVRGWADTAGTVTGNGGPMSGAFSVADPRPAWENRHSNLGLTAWDGSSRTITGGGKGPQGGALSVADPRIDGHERSVQHGVLAWDESSGVITGTCAVGGGAHAIADPRLEPTDFKGFRVVDWDRRSGVITGARAPGGSAQSVADPRLDGVRHNNVFRVVRFSETSPSITSGGHPTSGGLGIADPRCAWNAGAHESKLHLAVWEGPGKSVTGARGPYSGAVSVADPRPGLTREVGDAYRTAGHYGVIPWKAPSYAVTGALQHDNGRGNVADIRLPALDDKLQCVILAEDGTWHRPFTTLDMAALQSLLDPEEWANFRLHGHSDSAIRERIGNAVPSDAAQAIGSMMARTILLALSGETFLLSSEPIWVREQIAALMCGSAA